MIQVFKPRFHIDECLAEIKDSLEKGWTGLGDKTEIFENKWKEYTGYSHCHFINSATSGLHLALNILKEEHGWKKDNEIISTATTFISTNHAILYEHLTPVFADINESLCLDPNEVISKINSKTRAVIYVGLGGNISGYEKIVKICKEKKLILILDASHMSGSRYNGKIVGKKADVVINSFQAVKNLPTADSGMISFKDKRLDAIARKKSWMGITKDTYRRTFQGNYVWDYDVEDVGFKYHGNSIMAGIALVELKYLDENNAYRRQMFNWYKENLSNIKFITHLNKEETSQHLCQIIIDNRNDVIEKLHKDGINCGVHYKSNAEYKMYSHLKKDVPFSNKLQHKILSLPLHLGLTKNDINFISEKILEATNV